MTRDEAFSLLYATIGQWEAALATGRPLDKDDAALLASDMNHMRDAVNHLADRDYTD